MLNRVEPAHVNDAEADKSNNTELSVSVWAEGGAGADDSERLAEGGDADGAEEQKPETQDDATEPSKLNLIKPGDTEGEAALEAVEGDGATKGRNPAKDGEKADEEAGTEFLADPVEAFLMTIPPDWEKAKLHGKANMCVFDTTLDPENKDSYCICCNLPYPTEENFKSVTCANKDLGEMGAGYPMYFELIKRVGYLMLFLTLAYAVPSGYLIYRSYGEIKKQLADREDESSVAIFSFGSYIYQSKYALARTGLTASTEDGTQWMRISTALLVAVIFLSFLFLIDMRRRLITATKQLDMAILTPSDFCLMGKHMEFENYDPESIKQEIVDELRTSYEIQDVVYVNPVYDISDYYQVFAKYHELVKLKVMTDSHMKAYMDEHKCDKEKYKEIIKDP